MIKEVYEDLENLVEKSIDKLKKGQYIIEDFESYDSKVQIASLMQEVVIELGNCLEKVYNLYNSEIVNLLEKYCEDLYRFVIEEEKLELTRELKDDLELIMPKLRESVRVKNDVLSLVAIIKNEADYIIEWLEYHMMVGVTRFFIYDNDSTDNLYEKLKWYIDNDIVVYQIFGGTKRQLPAYNHAIDNYKLETKYMGFIDADEFLVPVLGGRIARNS